MTHSYPRWLHPVHSESTSIWSTLPHNPGTKLAVRTDVQVHNETLQRPGHKSNTVQGETLQRLLARLKQKWRTVRETYDALLKVTFYWHHRLRHLEPKSRF